MPDLVSIRSISSVASGTERAEVSIVSSQRCRRLVVVADPGERLQRAGARLGVMALGVAALAHVGRRRDIDLAERGVGDAARRGAVFRRRRNRRDDGDMPVARQMSGDFGEPADVLGAVGGGEAEIAVQPGAQGIAVQQHRRAADAEQPAFQRARQRRFAGARQAGQPDHRAVVAVARRALVGPQRGFDRHDVDGNGALPGVDRQHQAAAGDAAVDLDHQPPGARIVGSRNRRRSAAPAQCRSRRHDCARSPWSRRWRVRRGRPPSRSRPRWRGFPGCRAGPESRRLSTSGLSCSQKIRARIRRVSRGALPTWAMTSPRSMNSSRSSVMPTDRPAPWLPWTGVDRPALDAADFGDLAGGHDDDLVAGGEAAGFDAAGDDAAVVEFVDRLHRQPQRQRFQRPRRLERIQRLDHGRSVIPFDPRRAFGDAVAVARGNRNHRRRRHAEADQMRRNLVADLLEPVGAEIDPVHLVDDHGDLFDAEQMQQIAVAPGLVADAFQRVDDQHRAVGLRGAGDHVAQELGVAGRVDQHHVARAWCGSGSAWCRW